MHKFSFFDKELKKRLSEKGVVVCVQMYIFENFKLDQFVQMYMAYFANKANLRQMYIGGFNWKSENLDVRERFSLIKRYNSLY